MVNAGVLASTFEQSREPGLLDDETLFRRTPVAYLALLLGVAGLAWLMDRADRRGARPGLTLGALAGLAAAARWRCGATLPLWSASGPGEGRWSRDLGRDAGHRIGGPSARPEVPDA